MTNFTLEVALKADSAKNSNQKNYKQDFKSITSIWGMLGFILKPKDALLVGVFLCLQIVGVS